MPPSGRPPALLAALICLAAAAGCSGEAADVTLLNVSFDATRELYRQVNPAFARRWKEKTGQTVAIHQSHGGSGKQARAVIFGLEGDVVTLALPFDVDRIVKDSGRVVKDWRRRLPHDAVPFHSTVVFVVRRGNPHGVHDWEDLLQPGLALVMPSPKISGAARWNYLAAWGYARRRWPGNEARARSFLGALYKKVSVLDTSSRASTTTFAQREIGDVLVSWESEARLLVATLGADRFEVVTPPLSIRAELPVALVDANVDRHHTRTVAQDYLAFLFGAEGQALAAAHHFRPQDPAAARAAGFPQVELLGVDEVAGGWAKAHEVHFKEGGVFDQIYGGR